MSEEQVRDNEVVKRVVESNDGQAQNENVNKLEKLKAPVNVPIEDVDTDAWGDGGSSSQIEKRGWLDVDDDDIPVKKGGSAIGVVVVNGEEIADNSNEDDDETSKKEGFWASVWNLVISFPALVGTWCWPLVVAWVFMVAWYNVPLGLTQLFYALELAAMSVLVTNIFQYAKTLNKYQRRKNPDPTAIWLIGISIPLNLAMPFLVCVIYIGGYGMPEYKMWENGSWYPNTWFGITLWILKYIGFILLTIGLVRVTNLFKKTQKRWRQIRNGGQK